MSKPDHALILPISDIDLSRDAERKLRITGLVTAISPHRSSLVVVSDLHPADGDEAASVLVDLSLCAQSDADSYSYSDKTDAGGWSSYRKEVKQGPQRGRGVVPPELKSKVMIIGHLTKRDTPEDINWVTRGEKVPLIEPQVHNTISELRIEGEESALIPNRYFVLEALLFKPLQPSFDLALWNYTARLRSQHEWATHTQPPSSGRKDKGKRKAID